MRNSKLFVSVAVAISAMGIGAATAESLPVYNWTGFYLGANLGWSFGRSSTDYTVAGLPFGSTSQRMDGILGGLQAGYNWQNGRGVFGLEADIQATGQKGNSNLTDFIPGTAGTPARQLSHVSPLFRP